VLIDVPALKGWLLGSRVGPVLTSDVLKVADARRSRARAAFDRSVRLRVAGDRSGSARALDRALDKWSDRIPGACRRLIVSSVVPVDEPDDHEHRTASLLDAIDGARPDPSATEDWLHARYALTAHGRFEAAGAARANARDSAVLLDDPERADLLALVAAVRAAADLDDLTAIERLAPALRVGHVPPGLLDAVDRHLRIRNGDQRGAEPGDAAFRRVIEGASVALVGPAPLVRPAAAEIDACDVVVRLGHRGPSTLPPRHLGGERTDIAYYNRGVGRSLVQELPDFLRELRFAVLKQPGQDLGIVPTRVMCSPAPLLFAGEPLLGTIALFDLLLSNPASLKIYGMSLYASPDAYSDGYWRREAPPPWARCRSFAGHDLLDQVNYVRGLSSIEGVVPDEQLAEVLRMSEREYLRTIDRHYGAPTWTLPLASKG
jgi:hypothetical protein